MQLFATRFFWLAVERRARTHSSLLVARTRKESGPRADANEVAVAMLAGSIRARLDILLLLLLLAVCCYQKTSRATGETSAKPRASLLDFVVPLMQARQRRLALEKRANDNKEHAGVEGNRDEATSRGKPRRGTRSRGLWTKTKDRARRSSAPRGETRKKTYQVSGAKRAKIKKKQTKGDTTQREMQVFSFSSLQQGISQSTLSTFNKKN